MQNIDEQPEEGADFRNWAEGQKPNDNQLPSRFQINDHVSVLFRPDFVIADAKVIKVHFSESKVLYDLEVLISIEPDENHIAGSYSTTRIYNVDSGIVEPLKKETE